MYAMSFEWLENLTKPLASLLTPIAERVGGSLGHRKPHLYVHFTHPLVWCIAGNAGQEMMQTVCWADINHDDLQHALIITDIYPQGSRSSKIRASNFIVPPGQMAHEQLASFSVPIITEKGKPWVGRLILVDQFKRQHKTETVTFQWVGGAA
jgi:hypothetical protein